MSLSPAIGMPLATVACLCVYLTLANPVFAEESSHATATVAQKYGEIALAFGPNRGQAPFQAPDIYQLQGTRRIPVDGRYLLTASNEFAFQVGDYDHARPLVIDPVLGAPTR